MRVTIHYWFDNLEKRTGYKDKEEVDITLDDISTLLEKGLYILLKKTKSTIILAIDTRKFTQR